MAPKKSSTKREHEAKATPAAKKQKTDPCVEAVTAAIRDADILSETSRAMLTSAIPFSLAVPAVDRDVFQAAFVSQVGQALALIESNLQGHVDVENEKLTRVTESKTQLEAKLQNAQSNAQAAKEIFDEKTAALSKVEADMKSLHNQLAEKQQKLCFGKFECKRLKGDLAALQSCTDVDLPAICQCTDDASQLVMHYDALRSILDKLNVDESLLQILPTACTKKAADRGPIENLSLSALEKSMVERLASLAQSSTEASVSNTALATEILDLQSALRKVAEEQDSAKKSKADALGKKEIADAPVDPAQDALAKHDCEYSSAVASCAEKALALTTFKEYNLACFELLKTKPGRLLKEEAQNVSTAAGVDALAEQCQSTSEKVLKIDTKDAAMEESLAGAADPARILVAGG